MTRRVAILLDGGFVTKRLRSQLKRPVKAEDVAAHCDGIRKHEDLKGMDLLRIYFYDAPPAVGAMQNPIDGKRLDLGNSPTHRAQTALHQALEVLPNFALRQGVVAARGWYLKPDALKEISKSKRALQPSDLVPNIEQKGVDLRIGLDIARLSLQHLVDTLVVVTADSDLVPAFKFARREGIRIYLDHMGHGTTRELKVHADVII